MLNQKHLSSARPRLVLFLLASLFNALIAPIGVAARNAERLRFGYPSSPVQAQADFIRQVPLITNDVVFSASTGKLYASVPSRAGVNGNSIATIDPATGAVLSTVFVGSEPNRLALADDGQSLYVALDGAFAIRRFNIVTQTPGQQFSIGQDSFHGRYLAIDMAVAPGQPNVVAVARNYQGTSPPEAGVAVFDNGVQRPNTGPGHVEGSDFLAFSALPTKLFGTGFSSGLKTLTIDSSGVTVTNSTTFSNGARIKFSNGLVFSGSGQVINPDTSSLLGTFANANSSAFVPDNAAGRAYYVTGEQFGSGNITLRAYDINTFVPVGSSILNGVVGTPTSLLRWGTNGLALRTSANLYLIQTTLIPSADPVPSPTPVVSPTPTPSPSPIPTFIRQISLPTNDLTYSQSMQKLYASVPSSAGSGGNSITTIDPVLGTVGASVFVGSEPTKLAQADDSQTLYVGLEGAASVRRFNMVTQTAGLQLYLGNDSFNGPRTPFEIAVMPGSPGTVAVSRSFSTVALYDDGVQRPDTAGGGSIKFGSPTTLYSSSGPIQKLSVSPSGLATSGDPILSHSNGSIFVDSGLIYMSGGAVVDPLAQILKGTFTGLGFNALLALDSARGRAFFLTNNNGFELRSYDINTFVPIASVRLFGINGTPNSLVRWGTNGLAFRTSDGKVWLVQTALVDPTEAVATPTPTPSPTPSPSPPYVPTFVRTVPLQANDLVYSQATQSLYASVPSTAGSNGNSITKIAPNTGVVGPSVFIGSEPTKLAISDNGQTIYAGLNGSLAIRRFEISTGTPGTQFSVIAMPQDMEVLPGSPQSVALSRGGSGVAIYDNGVQRPNVSAGFPPVGPLEFGASAATLYGYNSGDTGFDLSKLSVTSSGVTNVSSVRNLVAGFVNGFEFSNGRLYTGFGRLVDPEAERLLGTFVGTDFSHTIAVDPTVGRAFFISNNFGSSSPVLTAFDINTFLKIGSVTLSGIPGRPVSLVRWGTNGLAFNTVNNFGPPGAPNASEVYVLQTELVSSSGTVPTGLKFETATISRSEVFGTIPVVVSRTGNVSAVTTVDYATSNGTATAGIDYTSTSGTLTFAAGEFTKTINVPITSDTLYEAANETFSVTLSNGTGGALLTSPTTMLVTIIDDDFKPSVGVTFSVTLTEGNSGGKVFPFTVTLSNPTVEVVTVDYTTADGTATAGSDFVSNSGRLTFPAGTTSLPINVSVTGDTTIEPNETFTVRLTSATNVNFFSQQPGTATILNDDATVQLGGTSAIAESSNSVQIPVNRIGASNTSFSVNYLTSDGTASQASDYTTASGTLLFVPGEMIKTITVLIADDAHVEGAETFTLTLSSPAGAELGTPASVTLSITDNDSAPSSTNPIDTPGFFVRQHYSDFLNRVPDQGGLDYWTGQLTDCGTDLLCMHQRRVGVSAAYFVENEFQRTGYVVYRMHRAAFGTWPGGPLRANIPYNTFMIDRGQLFDGPGLGQSTIDFANVFVQRPEFIQAYPTTNFTNAQFVNKLFDTADLIPFTSERQQQIDAMNNNGKTRAQVLLDVIEINEFKTREFNRAFVLMQYFGYLRRDPDQGGYDFWLGIVNNQALNNYRAMVCAFVTSAEYQQRFGTGVTRTNQDCAQ